MSEKSNIPVEIPASGIDLLGKKTGWVIGARGYELMRLETDKHMISIASTGGGKGRAVVIPNLLTHHGSVFSVEIGGTSYKESASYRRHVMGQEVHLIDPLGALDEGTACFNVLDTLNPKSPRFITEVTQVAESLLKDADGDKTQDPYFKHTPRALLAAFIIYVMTSDAVRDEDRHLPYVANLLGSHGSEKWHDLMNEFATDAGPYRDRLNKEGLYFRNKQTENTDSIVSTASIALSFARDPAFSRMLKTSSFKLSDLRDKKTSIYIVMPEIEHYKINAPLLRMLVERAFVACPNYGDGGRGFTHNDRVLFMLDEFTQLGKLDAVDTGMQTARQKGVTIWAIFQDLGRLEKLYGKEIAGSFLGAAGCVQVFDVGDERTKQYVSDRVGKGISYLPTVQHGVNWSQTQQSNWSETISLGINKTNTTGGSEAKGENWSRSIGTNETTSFGSNSSEGTTETYARRPVDSWFFAAPKPQSYAEQKSTGYSHTQATGKNETNMTGGSHVRTIQNSESTGTSEQEAKQNGGSQGVQQGGQYSVSFAPQILPKLQPADVEYFIGTDNRQIVFIRTNNRVQNFIDFRANWDQIPYLRGCALGPDSNLMPYPELLPPLQGPLKLPAAISYTPEPLILDLPEFPAVSETKINLQTLQQMAGRMSPSGIWKFLPQSWFNSKVRDEYEYISRQALKSAEAEIEYANKACEVYHPVSKYMGLLRPQEIRAIEKSRSLLHDAEKLQKEDEALFELSEELEKFRTRLVRDFKSEKSLEEGIKNYEERINALRSIQKKWTGMILPQRPGKVIAREMDDLSIKDAIAILNSRVTYSKKEPVRIKNYKVPLGEYSLDPQHQDDLMPDPSSISFSIVRDKKAYNFNGGQINLDGRPLSRFIELLNPLVDKPSHAVLNEARKTFWHHAAIKIHNNLLARERQMHDYMKSCDVAVASWRLRGAELRKYMAACNDSASTLKSRADLLEHERQRLLKRLHDLELANGKLETRRVTMFNNFSKSAAWGYAPEGEPIIRATVSFSAAAAMVAANANAPQGEQSYTQKTGNRHAPKP